MKKKQVRKHVTKANWSPEELKRIRTTIEKEEGNGPRAQNRIRIRMDEILNADRDERIAWRRKHHVGV